MHVIHTKCPRCLGTSRMMVPTNVKPGRGAGKQRALCGPCTLLVLRGAEVAEALDTWAALCAPAVVPSRAEVENAQRQGDTGDT